MRVVLWLKTPLMNRLYQDEGFASSFFERSALYDY